MINAFKVEFKFPWETMVKDLLKYSVQRQYAILMQGFASGKRAMLDVVVPRLDSGRQSGISETAFKTAKELDYHLIIVHKDHVDYQSTKIDNDKIHFLDELNNRLDTNKIRRKIENIKGVIVDASAMDSYSVNYINDAIYSLVKDNGDKAIPMVILG